MKKPKHIWRPTEGVRRPQPSDSESEPASFERTEASPSDQGTSRGPAELWRSHEGRPTVVSAPRRDAEVLATPPPAVATEGPALFSWRLVFVATTVLLILAVLGDASFALLRVNSNLSEMQSALATIERTLAEGDLVSAASGAQDASDAARDAAGAAGRPSLVMAQMIPGVQSEAETIDGVVAAAELAAAAGRKVVEAATTLGLNEEGRPTGLYEQGGVDLATLADARKSIALAQIALREATARLDALSPSLPQLQKPLADARVSVGEASVRLSQAGTVFDLLDPLLGGQGSRQYLLAFQTPSEARATGGLVGLAGLLRAEKGNISLGRIVPFRKVQPNEISPVNAPRWFGRSYAPQRALEQWRQANVSPNYPVVSEVLLEMYERSTGAYLDGVLAMDPIALAQLLGPKSIKTTEPSRTLDAANIAEVLLHDAYVDFDSESAQEAFFAEVVDQFWTVATGPDADLTSLIEGMGEAIQTGHMKIYSGDAIDKENLATLGLTGNYDAAGPAQMVFNINYGANKVDYFLHRRIDTDIALQPDGSARITTKVELENRAPAGPPSILLGGGEGAQIPPGHNRLMLNVLMPPESVVDAFTVNGQEAAPLTYVDDDSPVTWDVLDIPPGEEGIVEVAYSLPDALQLTGVGSSFQLSLFPQPTVNPDLYSVTVTPPPGMRIVESLVGKLRPNGSLKMSGTLGAPVLVSVLLGPQ